MENSYSFDIGLPTVPSEIVQLFLRESDLHLVAHLRGDADSASVFPLAAALRKLGKRVVCVHDVPAHLDWLIPADARENVEEVPESTTVVAVDTGNYSRLAFRGSLREKIKKLMHEHAREDEITLEEWRDVRKIDAVIDHHVSNPGYGAINWIDAKASSSSELVTALIVQLEKETGQALLDEDLAWRLYTGIASDTEWFKRRAHSGSYAAACYLEERFDIDKDRIAQSLQSQSVGYFLLGATLRQSFRLENAVASAFLDAKSIEDHGVTPEEAALLIEDLERLSARVSLLFVEIKPGEIRVRLRGRDVPIIGLAKQFGGGGHTFRAGAVIHSTDEMEKLLEEATRLANHESE